MAVGVEFDGAEFDGAESDGAEFDGADWTVTNAPSRLSDEEGSSFPGMNSNIMLAKSSNSSSCCGTSTGARFPVRPGPTLGTCMHASGTAEPVHSSDPDSQSQPVATVRGASAASAAGAVANAAAANTADLHHCCSPCRSLHCVTLNWL